MVKWWSHRWDLHWYESRFTTIVRSERKLFLGIFLLGNVIYFTATQANIIPPNLASGGLIILGLMLLGYHFAKEQWKTKLSLLGPFTIFAAAFTFLVYFRGVGILYFGVDPKVPTALEGQPLTSVYLSATYSIFMYLAIVSGTVLSIDIGNRNWSEKGQSVINRLDGVISIKQSHTLLASIVASLGVAIVGFYLMSNGNIAEFFAATDRNAYMNRISGRIGFGLLLFAYPVPALSLGAIIQKNQRSNTWTSPTQLFAIAAILMAFGLVFTHRGRTFFIACIFSCWVVLYLLYPNRRIGMTALLPVTIIAILLFFEQIEVVVIEWAQRAMESGNPEGPISNATPTPVETPFNESTGVTETPRSFEDNKGIYFDGVIGAIRKLMVSSGSSFDTFVTVLALTPESVPHDNGRHFLGLIYEFLPPGDRPIKGSEGFTHAYFPSIAGIIGRASPMISEFFWSFGYLGIGLVGVISGIWLTIWSRIVTAVSGAVRNPSTGCTTIRWPLLFIAPLIIYAAIMPLGTVTQFIPKFGAIAFACAFPLLLTTVLSKLEGAL